jgi:two-component system chemotaxis response regulator CheB
VESRGDRVPLVVIGGSAGALMPLVTIVRALPRGLPAAVCVVIHMPEHSSSELPTLLGRGGHLRSRFADDGTALLPGTVSVAPPGSHLLVEDGRLRLSVGARENGSRPAIDPLFRTAAHAHGPRVVSVLLSGTLDDGAAGTVAVRRAGGITITQDPAEAAFADMPRNAIATGGVSEVLPAATIAARIEELVGRMAAGSEATSDGDDPLRAMPPGDHPRGDEELDPVDRGLLGPAADLEPPPSPYSCPACGGVLYERQHDQYLCRLGHRYSPNTLSATQDEVVEDALWTALRSLEESASLSARVRDRAAGRGDDGMAARFDARRAAAEGRASRIRNVLRGGLHRESATQNGESSGDADAGAEADSDQAAPQGR